MKKIAIIGSGHLGQQIAFHVTMDKQFDVVGFFDDFQPNGEIIEGIPVLGKVEEVRASFKSGVFDFILIGVGYNHMPFRKKIFENFKNEVPFATFVHSSCIIDPSSVISEGAIVYPGCIIDQRTVLQENVLINVGCCIAHDTVIGAHSFVAPRVAIAGFVLIGESCMIGINSTIIDNIKITSAVILGGGTVVIKDIIESGLHVGSPSRHINKT
jgi:sugar O-acyltransferase (sialic acid O-acetyltransferase NeuD family)